MNGRSFTGGETKEGEARRSPGPAVPAGGDQPGAGIWISQLLKAAAAPSAERLEPADAPVTGQDTRWQISRQKDSAGWGSSWLREQGSCASLAPRTVGAPERPVEGVEGARPHRLPSGPTRLPDGAHDRCWRLGSARGNQEAGHPAACRCLGGVGRSGGPGTGRLQSRSEGVLLLFPSRYLPVPLKASAQVGRGTVCTGPTTNQCPPALTDHVRGALGTEGASWAVSPAGAVHEHARVPRLSEGLRCPRAHSWELGHGAGLRCAS